MTLRVNDPRKIFFKKKNATTSTIRFSAGAGEHVRWRRGDSQRSVGIGRREIEARNDGL